MTNKELQAELRRHSGDITVVLAVTDINGEIHFSSSAEVYTDNSLDRDIIELIISD